MADAAAAAPPVVPLPAEAAAAAAAPAAGPDRMGLPARMSPARGEYLQHSRDLVPVLSVRLPCNETPMRAMPSTQHFLEWWSQ